MRAIPFWKIRRELARLGPQILASPTALANFFLSTPYYDRVLAKQRLITEGGRPLTDKVGIYLVFPSSGLRASHLQAVHYLLDGGYAPLVVSNQPLLPEDRARLVPLCWRLIERPNFGYDFGGYRDGILSVGTRLASLDRLVLLNDSAWFPLPGGYDWLSRAEAAREDYCAAIWANAVKHPNPEHYRDIRWVVNKNRRNFHYASFALSLSSRILRDPDFLPFWQNFRLTGRKHKAVRRGEVGLTRWVIDHGFSHAATTELTDLDKILRDLPDDRVRLLLDHLLTPNDHQMADCRKRFSVDLAAGRVGRTEIEQVILTSVARQGASYALMEFLCREYRFPFMKKSLAKMGGPARQVVDDVASDLADPFGAEIRAEIAQMRAERP